MNSSEAGASRVVRDEAGASSRGLVSPFQHLRARPGRRRNRQLIASSFLSVPNVQPIADNHRVVPGLAIEYLQGRKLLMTVRARREQNNFAGLRCNEEHRRVFQ